MNHFFEQLDLDAPKRALILTRVLIQTPFSWILLTCSLHLAEKWQNLGTIHWLSKKKSQWRGVQGTIHLGLFVFTDKFFKTSHRKENFCRSLNLAGKSWFLRSHSDWRISYRHRYRQQDRQKKSSFVYHFTIKFIITQYFLNSLIFTKVSRNCATILSSGTAMVGRNFARKL